MASKRISDSVKESHLQLLNKYGEDGLYERAIAAGIIRAADLKTPETEMLDLADAFVSLYRRTGNENFATISQIMRRAAHVVYRQLNKNRKDKKFRRDNRLLTSC